MGLMSPFDDWCDDVLVFEFGVVDTPDWGEPGLTSLDELMLVFEFDSDLMVACELCESVVLFDAFCWASLSCFLNFALRF